MHIALLTDFGTRDPYVAAMKGVLASRCQAQLVDLTHEIAPFDVREAAWFIRSAVPFWPEGTIFVVVVDPGVGTSRKILAARQDGRTFLAPDNGVLSFVLTADAELRSVENSALFLPNDSTTFHGRDRFAPVAAALANGAAFETLGPPMSSMMRLDYTPPDYTEDTARGSIVAVDRFGNLITDIERDRLKFGDFELHARDLVVDRVGTTYAEAGPGPFLIAGSSGCIEISVANGSAAEKLRLRRGQRVELRKRPV
ncbi:MAG TPA: SAM-dependent chlorinase/fluorinase [Thermoanaerobaculia bacterium]|nr:SAM-dependent chlorinase/fluorinase [Thermoanaerobaculia bacterium]